MDGWIEQSGKVDSTGGSEITVSFDTNFNYVPNLVCVPHHSGNSAPVYGNFGYSINNANFKVQAWQSCDWKAIGY